ncbi:MAG: class I SAM-dependent methyltransferase [Candidatus Omnitrophica bacterium]|nr:class I SAM-dependent methyltransferase [Candidatus Omnitrophota bacterium]
MNILLPDKGNIPVTGPEDPALFYYKSIMRNFYLKRLALAVGLIDKESKENILDLGYGSGILLPELSRHSQKIFGLDSHLNAGPVKKMLKKENKFAYLASGDISNLPYKNDSFDCIVCLSVLEHMENLDSCIDEIVRVARPSGQIIVGVPVDNFLMSLGFKSMGYNVCDIHKWGHRQIIKAVQNKIKIERLKRFPFFVGLDYSFYIVLNCRKL